MAKTRTTKKKSGPKGGRPAYVFTPAALADLATLAGAANTIDDIASVIGVSKRTLETRIAWNEKLDSEDQDEVAQIYRKAVAGRRSNLRVAQYALAIGEGDRGPNPTMLIWLGKQDLGQRDFRQLEVSGPAGGPVTVNAELLPELEQKLVEFLKNRQGPKKAA